MNHADLYPVLAGILNLVAALIRLTTTAPPRRSSRRRKKN